MTTCSTRHQHAAPPDPGILARLASLPDMTMPELQVLWRELHSSEPPRSNRKFIESRLAYRIQELAYGGLKAGTRARLAALADEIDAPASSRSRRSADARPIAGTRLIREWQGVEEVVTVLDDGFAWQGRPYASLSSVARAITGTRWNGPLFFCLRSAARGRA